jgi:hypothetical protein
MQVFDQQIALMGAWTQHFSNVPQGGLIKLASARELSGMFALGVHGRLSKLKNSATAGHNG